MSGGSRGRPSRCHRERQLTSSSCPHCNGKGERITRHCGKCNGERTIQAQNTLAVHVPAGAPEGYEEVFSGEADQNPDYDAGDVIVRVRSQPKSNKGWTRKESGLVGRVTLSVAEVSSGRRELGHGTALTPPHRHCLDSSATSLRSTDGSSLSVGQAPRSPGRWRSSRARE